MNGRSSVAMVVISIAVTVMPALVVVTGSAGMSVAVAAGENEPGQSQGNHSFHGTHNNSPGQRTSRATATFRQEFVCDVIKVHDGDGPLWCRNGPKVRIAGVQAPDFESAEPCRQGRAGYVCSDVRARASQQIVERMLLHRHLNCFAIEPSYDRMVARCSLPGGRDLSCAVIAAGAAVRWDTYWRRYRMGGC